MNEYIKVVLQADPLGMIQGFREAEGAFENFKATIDAGMRGAKAGGQVFNIAADQISSLGKKTFGAGLAMSGGYALATKRASAFQVQMKNVQSLTKATNHVISDQEQAIFSLARSMPQDPTTLAEGLYEIASTGFEGAEGLEILEQSAIAASAGLTNTDISAKAILSTLNAYGLEASAAADVSDVLFQTVNVGALRFEELAAGMGNWVGMAAQIGVGYDEAAAAIATMTLAGVEAQTASTYLSRLMESFLQPSEAMSEAVAAIGYNSAIALVDAEGLGGAVLALNDELDGNREAMNALFPSIQAYRGALAIASAEGSNWERTSAAITDAAGRQGAALDVYGYQTETLAAQFTLLKNNISNSLIEVGKYFVTPLRALNQMSAAVIGFFSELIDPVRVFVNWGGAAIATFLTLAGAAAAWGSKILLTKWLLKGLGSQILKLAVMMPESLGQKMLVGFGTKIQSTGKLLRGFAASLEAAGGLIGKFGGSAGRGLEKLRGLMTPKNLGIAGLVAGIGLLTAKIISDFGEAEKAGKKLGKAFGEDLDRNGVTQIRNSIKAINEEIKNQEQIMRDLGTTADQGFTEDDLNSILNPFDGAKELERAEARAYYKELQAQREKLQEEAIKTKGLATAVYLERENVSIDASKGLPYEINEMPPIPDNMSALGYWEKFGGTLDQAAEAYMNRANRKSPLELWLAGGDEGLADMGDTLSKDAMFSIEKMMYDMERLARANGISLDFADGDVASMEEASSALGTLYDQYRSLPAASQTAMIAFGSMGEAADDTATNIERLEGALQATVASALGLEGAEDALQGSINSIYELVQELREENTLDIALDLNSYHQDALSLRGEWRSLVDDLVGETTAWAEAQGEVTGADIEGHLAGQIEMLRARGREMFGDSEKATQFVENYVSMLQEVIDRNLISVNFQDNVPEAKARGESYLRQLLDTPGEVTTFFMVAKSQGEAALRQWLNDVGIVDETQVDTAVNANTEVAYANLIEYLDQIDVAADKDSITNLLTVLVEGDTDKLKEVQDEMGIEDQELQYILDIVGDTESATFLGIFKLMIQAVDREKASPTVDINDEATNKIGDIQSALNALVSRQYKATVIEETIIKKTYKTSGNPTNDGKPGTFTGDEPYNEDLDYAFGGIVDFFANGAENHVAQIAPAGAWRLWAEPETGGEAYIPLAKSKRQRSEAILGEVAKRFGIGLQKYAIGGLDQPLSQRFRPSEKKDAQGRTQKEREQDEKAFYRGIEKMQNDAKQAQEEAARELEEQRQHTRDVAKFEHEMGTRTDISYAAFLKLQLGQYEAFSDEWMGISRDLASHMKDMAQKQRDLEDNIWSWGAQSYSKRMETLRKRIATEKWFSKEWWDIANELLDMELELGRQRYDVGTRSLNQYVGFLMGKLKGLQMWSTRWIEIHDEIMEVQDTAFQNMNDVGAMSTKKYLEHLKRRRDGFGKFTDEWKNYNDQIVDIERSALSSVADIYSKFGDRMSFSYKSLQKYLERSIKLSKDWNKNMQALAQTGVFTQDTLAQLRDAGPASGGIVKALLAAVQAGDGQALATLIAQATAAGISTASFDQGGYLPPGYTLAYNGTGRPEPVGHDLGSGPAVVIQHAEIKDSVDVDMLGNKVGFAVASRKI